MPIVRKKFKNGEEEFRTIPDTLFSKIVLCLKDGAWADMPGSGDILFQLSEYYGIPVNQLTSDAEKGVL